MVHLAALLAVGFGTAGRLVTLSALLPEMRAAGDPGLVLSPELRNEAIYLRGGLGAPARLRALVAHASSAEWVIDGSVLRLERPPALRRRLSESERASRTAEYKAAFGPVAAGRDPEAHAAERLTRALGPEWLAALPPVGIARFLGHGGNGLLALPFDPSPILAAYRSETAAAGGARLAGGLEGSGLGSRYGAILAAGEPGLTAERTPYGLTVVRLYAVAPEGEAALVATAEIATEARGEDDPAWPLGTLPTGPANRLPAIPGPKREAVAAALLRPGTEPLTLTAAPFLDRLAGAAAIEGPVVLDLPDEAAGLSSDRPSTMEADARRLRAFVVTETFEGATVGHPRLPITASAERLPRAEIPVWARLVARPAQGLDEASTVAERVGDLPLATGLERTLAQRAGFAHAPQAPYGFSIDAREQLRLWAALPASARAALDAGGAVRLGGLPSATQVAGGKVLVRMGGRMGSGPLFLDRDGPPQAVLSWALQVSPGALILDKAGPEAVYDAEGLGSLIGEQEKGRLLDPAFGLPDLRRSLFQPAVRLARRYGFSYAPQPVPAITGVLQEVRLGDGPPGEWPALPPEVLAPLRRSLDAVRSGRVG